MTGFLAKLRVVTLGTAHDLIDKTIDMNSPSALRQYVRDLEEALEHLRNEAAGQAGMVRTLTREIQNLQTKIAGETDLVTKILAGPAPNKMDIARTKGTTIVTWKKELEGKQVEIEEQKKTSADVDAAVAKLEAKHSLMVAKVRELEHLDQTTKAKEQGANALEQAGKLVGNGVDISVDDVESKMKQRNDVASEKFDRAMGTVQVGNDAETSAAVDDLLASLQQPQTK